MGKEVIASLAGMGSHGESPAGKDSWPTPVAPSSIRCCSQFNQWLLICMAWGSWGVCWGWIIPKPRVARGGQRGGRRDGTLSGDGLQQGGHRAFGAGMTFAIQCAIRSWYTR